MGSILARSEMQKNKMEECVATGLYPFRVSSISFSVAVAISWKKKFELTSLSCQSLTTIIRGLNEWSSI